MEIESIEKRNEKGMIVSVRGFESDLCPFFQLTKKFDKSLLINFSVKKIFHQFPNKQSG